MCRMDTVALYRVCSNGMRYLERERVYVYLERERVYVYLERESTVQGSLEWDEVLRERESVCVLRERTSLYV